MARPTNPNSTRIIKATSTMAWPRCGRLEPPTISVFRPVDGPGNDDDVAGELLNDRGDRHEVVADRHLQRSGAIGRIRRPADAITESPHLAPPPVFSRGG